MARWFEVIFLSCRFCCVTMYQTMSKSKYVSLLGSWNRVNLNLRFCFVFLYRPDYISPLDDLAFDMYQDPEIAQIIRKLERKKQEAVLRMCLILCYRRERERVFV